MRYYFNFYTDLPDQFVEANIKRLRAWAGDLRLNAKRFWVLEFAGVEVRAEYAPGEQPRLLLARAPDSYEIQQWMLSYGGLYSGVYWESLTEAERSPPPSSGSAGRGHPLSGTADLTDPTTGRYYGAVDTASGEDTSVAQAGAISNKGLGLAYSKYVAQTLSAQQAAQLQALAHSQHGLGQMTVHPGYWQGMLGVGHKTPVPVNPQLKREMVAGEILAYRCWRLLGKQDSLRLRSVAMGDVWEPGQIMVGRGIENWGERGIHAWKGHSEAYLSYTSSVLAAAVRGTVLLWGDVVEHELGYRTEYAKINSIDWVGTNAFTFGQEQKVLEQLRETYGVS